MIRAIVHLLFTTFTFMLFIRVALSFFPTLQHRRFAHFLRFYTEPYLGLFRRFIPPIGGAIDISPTIGLLALHFLDSFLMKIL